MTGLVEHTAFMDVTVDFLPTALAWLPRAWRIVGSAPSIFPQTVRLVVTSIDLAESGGRVTMITKVTASTTTVSIVDGGWTMTNLVRISLGPAPRQCKVVTKEGVEIAGLTGLEVTAEVGDITRAKLSLFLDRLDVEGAVPTFFIRHPVTGVLTEVVAFETPGGELVNLHALGEDKEEGKP